MTYANISIHGKNKQRYKHSAVGEDHFGRRRSTLWAAQVARQIAGQWTAMCQQDKGDSRVTGGLNSMGSGGRGECGQHMVPGRRP